MTPEQETARLRVVHNARMTRNEPSGAGLGCWSFKRAAFTRIPLISAAIAVLLLSPLSEAKQNWIEVRSPHFLVVTNAGEKRGRDTALHLERIRAFFQQSLAVAAHHPSPFVTVLAVKDGQTMREVLEQYWGERQPHIAGVFAQRLDQYFAVVELDTQRAGYRSEARRV